MLFASASRELSVARGTVGDKRTDVVVNERLHGTDRV